jgi:hypothetical protein
MSDDPPVTLPTPAAARVPARDDEPPVVARLIVEIRSDGSRTIARGAVEDTVTGERTAVEARGTTPLSLMVSLSRAVFQVPALARRAARALLPGKPFRRE